MKKALKYKSNKIEYNGIKFDSKLELRRYRELLLLQNNGYIESLELQPSFLLQDKFYVIINGKKTCVRSIKYIADFKYIQDGKTVIEDTKGFETKDYIIKRKLFLQNCEFDIFREVKYKSTIEYLKNS